MSSSESVVGLAVQAFEDVERVRFLLERKERELEVAVARCAVEAPDSEAVYYEATEMVLDKYADKREKSGLTGESVHIGPLSMLSMIVDKIDKGESP